MKTHLNSEHPSSSSVPERDTSKPMAMDLFSGCGGLSLGLKQAGFSVIGAIELDHLASESYRANHPETRLWTTDIRILSTMSLKRQLGIRKGDLDLLAGCPPCQGFSSLVTNNGLYRVDDPRNNLIYEFRRFVEDFMPRAVLVENVPDLIKTTRFKRFRVFLESLGYVTEFKLLDAADYGVPQRRKRMVFLAGLKSAIPFASQARSRRTVRAAIAGLFESDRAFDPLSDTSSQASPRIRHLIRSVPKDGGSRKDVVGIDPLKCHQSFEGFSDVYGRMRWDAVAPTITSGCINASKGRFLHPVADRVITLREAATLQSFPVSYKISLRHGKYMAATQIGNAFPPEFARRQAIAIRRFLAES